MIRPTRKRLPNGLSVVYLPLPHVHAAALSFTARGGPRYERRLDNGLSHVMEHLLFRGTRAHPDSLSFHSAVEALGAEINGETHRDTVGVHLTVPPRATAEAARLLAEACISPLLTGLDVEREVIIEEILDTHDGDGRDLDIDHLSRRRLWPDHAMGRSITGSIAQVEAFTEADARRWHRETFVADNAVLVVAGPLPVDDLHPEIARAFCALPAGRRQVEPAPPAPPRWAPLHVQPSEDAQITALLTYPAPHEHHPGFAPLQLLQRVLDDGFGARLRQAICEQRGLAYSLAVSMDAYADCAALDVELSCAPDKLVTAVQEALRVLDEVGRAPVPGPELMRAKRRHEADLEFCLDDPGGLGTWIAGAELMQTRGSYYERLVDVLGVSGAAVADLARHMFAPEHAILTLVGPADRVMAAQLARALHRNPESTVWSEAPSAPALTLPAAAG